VRDRLCTADRELETAYGRVSTSYFLQFWQRAAKAVGAEVDELGENFLRVRRGSRWTFAWRFMVMLDTYMSRMIVDDKPLTQRLLADQGWVQPRQLEFHADRPEAAFQFMDDLGERVVVKPKASSGGRGITTGIRTHAELERAAEWASTFGHALIVEEHVAGDSYRLLFLDGELIDTVRRCPPTVVGDGEHDIRTLVRLENKKRLSAPPFTSLIPLKVDLDCTQALLEQGLSLHTVPPPGQLVRVKTVVNQNAARDNHTVRTGVHPSFVELGGRFSRVLNLGLFGMDVITPDISSPLEECGGILNELNIPPGLHYHDLVSDEGAKAPIGQMVLEAALSKPHGHGVAG